MKKSLFVSVLTFAIALGIQAQTESEKAPVASKKSRINPAPIPNSGAKGGSTSAKADENGKPMDQSNFDTSVKPSDDFFLYANGGWIKRTEIPPDKTRWGSFNELIEHNNDALHAIAEKAAKTKSSDPTTQKVGDYYASGMDEKAIEAAHTKSLADEIAKAGQGGLGMPDRDYYTKDDDASKKLRDQYVAHITKMLTLLGEPAEKAADDAKKIMALGTS